MSRTYRRLQTDPDQPKSAKDTKERNDKLRQAKVIKMVRTKMGFKNGDIVQTVMDSSDNSSYTYTVRDAGVLENLFTSMYSYHEKMQVLVKLSKDVEGFKKIIKQYQPFYYYFDKEYGGGVLGSLLAHKLKEFHFVKIRSYTEDFII